MGDIAVLEDKLRAFVTEKRLRVKNFFTDFDRRRLGKIPQGQFVRALGSAGLILTPEEINLILSTYATAHPDLIDYTKFVDSVELPYEAKEKGGSAMPAGLVTLLPILKKEVIKLGLVPKYCWRDFDRGHRGTVSKTQFLRGMPFQLPPAQLDMLTHYYSDGDSSNGVDYVKFHGDLITEEEPEAPAERKKGTGAPIFGHTPKEEYGALLEKVRSLCLRDRIKIADFIAPFDRLNRGTVSREKFGAGVRNALPRYAFKAAEIDCLADQFLAKSFPGAPPAIDAINYRDFAADIDIVFAEPNLHLNPTKDMGATVSAQSLVRGDQVFMPPPAAGSPEEALIKKAAYFAAQRRRQVKPLFRDYDKHRQGLVTTDQFVKVCVLLDVGLDGTAATKLAKVYVVREREPCVHYISFVRDIRPEEIPHSVDMGMPPMTDEDSIASQEVSEREVPAFDIDGIIAEIKANVVVHRLRVDEFLRDFDPLRSGKVTPDQFVRGLMTGDITDSAAKAAALAESFMVVEENGVFVKWLEFCDIVNEVFEDDAGHIVRAESDFNALSQEEWPARIKAVLKHFAKTTKMLQLDLKPFFQAFDRHHIGYCTPEQFKRVLLSNGLEASVADIDSLVAFFSNPAKKMPSYVDFCKYIAFPTKFLGREDTVKERVFSDYKESAPELGPLLKKVAQQALRKRIRLEEFMVDNDPLNHGIIPKGKFISSLGMAGLVLTDLEVQLLVDSYVSKKDPSVIDYPAFIAVVRGIELDPVVPRTLQKETSAEVDAIVSRLRNIVTTRRMLLRPFFKDFDRINAGLISTNQFRSVLTSTNLGFKQSQIDALIAHYSDDEPKNPRVNYVGFCQDVNSD